MSENTTVDWGAVARLLARSDAEIEAEAVQYDRGALDPAQIEAENYSAQALAEILVLRNLGDAVPTDPQVEAVREVYREELVRCLDLLCAPGPIVAEHRLRYAGSCGSESLAVVLEYARGVAEFDGVRGVSLAETREEAEARQRDRDHNCVTPPSYEWRVERGAPHLRAAALLAWSLQHGCAPYSAVHQDLASLHRGQVEAAEEHDVDAPGSLPAAARWDEVRQGLRLVGLRWVTATGRLRLEVGGHRLVCGLYSPAHVGGESAYVAVVLDCSARAPRVRTHLSPAIRELCDERLDRLDHLLGCLDDAVSVAAIVAGVEDEHDRDWLRLVLLYRAAQVEDLDRVSALLGADGLDRAWAEASAELDARTHVTHADEPLIARCRGDETAAAQARNAQEAQPLIHGRRYPEGK